MVAHAVRGDNYWALPTAVRFVWRCSTQPLWKKAGVEAPPQLDEMGYGRTRR